MKKQYIGVLLTLLTTFSWSLLAIALKFSTKFLDSTSIVGVRFLVATLSLLLLSLIRYGSQIHLLSIPPLLPALACGTFLAGNYITYMLGIELTSASNCQLFIQIGPIVLFAWGVLYNKESVNPLQRIGLVLSFLGFIFFYQDHIKNFLGHELSYHLGSLWIVASAISWASFAIIQRTVVRKNSALLSNLFIFFFASLFFVPVANWKNIFQLNLTQYLILLYLGLNTTLAYGSLSIAFRYLEPSRISVLITLSPMMTIALIKIFNTLEFSWVEHEPVRLCGYMGASLVVMGAMFVIGFNRK